MSRTKACKQWLGAVTTCGCPVVREVRHGRLIRAGHELVWIDANGRLPSSGMVIRRICKNLSCVEVSHLEEVALPTVVPVLRMGGVRADGTIVRGSIFR